MTAIACRLTSTAAAPASSPGGGHDWTPRFAALASALTDLPANNLVLDGEVIVQGDTGVADFDALQAELASGRSERMVFALELPNKAILQVLAFDDDAAFAGAREWWRNDQLKRSRARIEDALWRPVGAFFVGAIFLGLTRVTRWIVTGK